MTEITLRDYFAAKAMAAMLQDDGYRDIVIPSGEKKYLDAIASLSYDAADAMLKHKKETEQKVKDDEAALSDFNKKLIESQKPIDSDIAKALADAGSDVYAK